MRKLKRVFRADSKPIPEIIKMFNASGAELARNKMILRKFHNNRKQK